jgi:arginine deiminase
MQELIVKYEILKESLDVEQQSPAQTKRHRESTDAAAVQLADKVRWLEKEHADFERILSQRANAIRNLEDELSYVAEQKKNISRVLGVWRRTSSKQDSYCRPRVIQDKRLASFSLS